jgi:predicted metal-dependent hydrolase
MNKYQAILNYILPEIEVYPVDDTENWARVVTYRDRNNVFKHASIYLSVDTKRLPIILMNYVLYHEYAHIINNILNPHASGSHGTEYQEILDKILPTHRVFQQILREYV